jgi:hypothetical protein
MYTNNKTQKAMGPTLKPFEVLESVVSVVVTFPTTHGQLIYAGLPIEICFFFGSLYPLIAVSNAVFVFLCVIMVEEVRHFI